MPKDDSSAGVKAACSSCLNAHCARRMQARNAISGIDSLPVFLLPIASLLAASLYASHWLGLSEPYTALAGTAGLVVGMTLSAVLPRTGWRDHRGS